MKDRDLRRLLVTAPLPDDLGARRRSWAVVRHAFEDREPFRRLPSFRPALYLAAAAALLAAALSPAGEAVVKRVREAIGVEKAKPALFSLPAGGRVLVSSTRGVWIVQRDGSKRLLGRYREASWSPSGLYVVAARHNELAALDPQGELQWSLARPAVRRPRWAGLHGDTRVAYFSGERLRVVAGDGTGDRAVGAADRDVPPAWRTGVRHVVAYVDARGRVAVYDADARAVEPELRVARRPGGKGSAPRALQWSRGGRLLVVTGDGLLLTGGDGRPARWRVPGVLRAAFSPDGRRVALLRRSDVLLLDVRSPKAPPRRVFAGAGLSGLAWSPDGRWLLIGWQTADQWVFVRVGRDRRIEAVDNVTAQFRSRRFPVIEGWCCAR